MEVSVDVDRWCDAIGETPPCLNFIITSARASNAQEPYLLTQVSHAFARDCQKPFREIFQLLDAMDYKAFDRLEAVSEDINIVSQEAENARRDRAMDILLQLMRTWQRERKSVWDHRLLFLGLSALMDHRDNPRRWSSDANRLRPEWKTLAKQKAGWSLLLCNLPISCLMC